MSGVERTHTAFVATDPQGGRESFKSFMANRIESDTTKEWIKKKKNYTSKRRREMAGKTINFKKASPEVQQGLLTSRRVEWQKYQTCNG
jgi:uncharacterized protein YbaP (TraB family)